MSLPARQERVLRRMAGSLHSSEPHLTSIFAMFTKLTRNEDMPRREALGVWRSPWCGWRQRLLRPRWRGRAASGARWAWAPAARLRAILLVPIMLAALAPAVFVGLGGHNVSRCGPAARPQHAAPALSWPSACLSLRQRLPYQRLPSG